MGPNSKNLQYQKPEVPFLKGIQIPQANDSDAPRQSVYGTQRSKKKKDEDDGPLILDEEGNEVTKAELVEMESGGPGEGKTSAETVSRGEDNAEGGKDNSKDVTTTIGSGKKRKKGKLVGEDNDVEKQENKASGSDEESSGREADRKKSKGVAKKTAKKQKKPVGLSFVGEDE